MKKILWIVLAVSSLGACKKSGVTLSSNLIGKWELQRRYGGNINPPDTAYKPGNGNIFQFNADSTYKSYVNGVLTASGVFHVRRYNTYQVMQTPYDELYFGSDSSFTYLINVSGTVLTFSPLIPDVGTTQYNKISN